MKMQRTLLLAILFLIPAARLIAAETEPNNTRATANTLALNGSNTGAISVSGDEDWWKVTTNADGRLNITITISNSLNLRCQLYDNDGITTLNSSYTASTITFSQDGLAAGTYYLKVYPYYSGQLPAYTISNTLTLPAQANDAEPNNTAAQAKVLNLNNSKTGHVGYYYSNARDTSDWYKVTTNADGRLRLTMTSHNGQNVYAYLYDADGTTLLRSGYTSTSGAVVNEDGLAAGTYYIRVKTYYTTEWAPYSIADSLFTPAQANDVESNNNRATAIALPLNSSKTGHAGYYYNKVRDSSDWYKVATNADGMLSISITSHNGQNVYAYLYDNDGTRLLESAYTSSSTSYTVDGLQPGTYYVKIKTYYTTEWAPYTLGNTLATYANTNDPEPNDTYAQAKTIPSNSSVSGHVNFYYNGNRDAEDRWKINYTGSGNMTLVFNQENRLKYGSAVPTYFRVYKDTNAAPLSGSYYSTNTNTINLTNLTQGYYYIKINTYYSTELSNLCSYNISATFTQVAKAKVKAASFTTAPACTSTNSISFKCSAGNAPFTVQLYRYGVVYGSQLVTTKNANFTNLPAGAYYATVYADGATGTSFGKSANVVLVPIPTGTSTTTITTTQAKTNWTIVACAKYYAVQYRVKGAANWTNKKTTTNTGSYTITGLTPATIYEWKVAAVDSANSIIATGVFTDSLRFTTPAAFALNSSSNDAISKATRPVKIVVTPNPAVSFVTLQTGIQSEGTVTITVTDMNGKAQFNNAISASQLHGYRIQVSGFSAGLYMLQVTDKTGALLASEKIVVQR